MYVIFKPEQKLNICGYDPYLTGREPCHPSGALTSTAAYLQHPCIRFNMTIIAYQGIGTSYLHRRITANHLDCEFTSECMMYIFSASEF